MSFLIIGTGKRVENLIIPTLIILKKNFSICGRNIDRLKYLSKKYNIKNDQIFNIEIIKSKIEYFDNFVFSLPSNLFYEKFFSIFKKYSKKKINIYFETPFCPPLRNLFILRNKNFNFLIIEDGAKKPINSILERSEDIFKSKLIKIYFCKSLYFYHGLSFIKLICKKRISFAKTIKEKKIKKYFFKFEKISCYMTFERNYDDCYSFYEFENHIILDKQFNQTNSIPNFNKKIYYFSRNFSNGVLKSVHLFDTNNKSLLDYDLNINTLHVDLLRDLNYQDQERIYSLIHIFNKKYCYSFSSHIKDIMIIFILNKFKFFHKIILDNIFVRFLMRKI